MREIRESGCRRRRDTWSRLGVLASVATLTVIVAACGGSGGGPGGNDNAALPDKKLEGGVTVDIAAEPTGEISIAVPADAPGDIALRRKQAEAFEAKYPKVTVKLTTIPSDGYDQKILTLIAGGKAPDIFGSGDVVIPTIVNRNYALDLKPYMEADKFDTEAFYPEVIDGLTYEGKIVGLTDNWDTQVMYYNRALFQAAGVEEPTADWTWDDYKAAAAKLTSGEGPNKVWGSLWQKWFVPTLDIVQAAGGTTYSADGSKCELTSPEAIEALTFLDELRESGSDPGYVTQDARNVLGRSGDDVFKQGKAAMMVGDGRWASYDFATVKNLDWAVAPLPKGPAGRANFFHLAMNAIPSNSKNPSAAWAFLRYITSPEGVELGIDNVQGIPAREEIAKSDAVSGSTISTEHDAYEPFIESLESAKRSPQLTNFFKYQDKVDQALQPLWKGQKSPAEAAANACKAVDAQLADA